MIPDWFENCKNWEVCGGISWLNLSRFALRFHLPMPYIGHTESMREMKKTKAKFREVPEGVCDLEHQFTNIHFIRTFHCLLYRGRGGWLKRFNLFVPFVHLSGGNFATYITKIPFCLENVFWLEPVAVRPKYGSPILELHGKKCNGINDA